MPTQHDPSIRPRPLGTVDGRFRTGQWVLVNGPFGGEKRVGIHVRSVGIGTAEVHLVNDRGETVIVIPEHPVGDLEPAMLEDIPSARRPASHPRYASRRA